MKKLTQRLLLCFWVGLVGYSHAGDYTLDVSTKGQFVKPQMYHVAPGTRIAAVSSHWQLKKDAYPLGIALTREQDKREQSRVRWALQYRLQDMHLASKTRTSLYRQITSFVVTGRVLWQFEWDIVGVKPQQNRPLLQGDTFIAPKRPSSIIVGGAAKIAKLPFKGGVTVRDYMQLVNRLPGADPSDVWVITPDTKIRKIGVSYWNAQKAYLAPGSVLYVPLSGHQDFNDSMAQLYAAQILPY
ncbi:capsule biosynthesis GfcC family protein [Celerinatantimonas diazotrophica]|uniref:Capsule biosynthesis protein GfcC n=1 Tax=Celerinatantimonas diazotrophica TaxID=412034 RepID=A0A4R1K4J8_9GAMM|nr:capsule biosynthesis GfcC family protein [Celerinatantimonas diazotrophica]TCK59066.1 capsule biosynthesis protein GfcC [Celerinatantimonas diazotrophica]CAG9297701.1 hypothetical protein CEDIAZO_02890 [Celerinatantimonas diazotrophica]